MTFRTARGATPLSEEDRRDLIPNLTTQQELNEFEINNIRDGTNWARKSRILKSQLLTMRGICLLHEKMLDKTWRWAGKLRLRALTSIGVAPHQIQTELGNLFNDVKFWIENETFPPDEIAIRFSHRLVQIHPFRDGNGRHSRLAADLLAVQLGRPRFTWGDMYSDKVRRAKYIEALNGADRSMDVTQLLEFARN